MLHFGWVSAAFVSYWMCHLRAPARMHAVQFLPFSITICIMHTYSLIYTACRYKSQIAEIGYILWYNSWLCESHAFRILRRGPPTRRLKICCFDMAVRWYSKRNQKPFLKLNTTYCYWVLHGAQTVHCGVTVKQQDTILSSFRVSTYYAWPELAMV